MNLVQAMDITQSQMQSSFCSTPTSRLQHQLVGLAANATNEREFAWKKEVEFDAAPKHSTTVKNKTFFKKKSMLPHLDGPSSPMSLHADMQQNRQRAGTVLKQLPQRMFSKLKSQIDIKSLISDGHTVDESEANEPIEDDYDS